MSVHVRASSVKVTSGGAASQTIPFPGVPQVGDIVLISGVTGDAAHTITAPAGWTLIYSTPVGTGSRHLLVKKYEAADGAQVVVPTRREGAANAWIAGSAKFAVVVFDGAFHETINAIGPITTRPSSSTQTIAAATGAAGDDVIYIVHDKTTNQTGFTVAAAGGAAVTQIQNVLPGSGYSGSIGIGYYDTTSGAATVTATYNMGSGNGAGLQIVLVKAVTADPVGTGYEVADGAGAAVAMFTITEDGPRTPSDVVPMASGFTTVAQMLATPGYTIAHRAGSLRYPECSLDATTQAIRHGYGAIEISLARTSDGVWFGLHDQDINRCSGVSGLPAASAMTWAQVQNYLNYSGSRGLPGRPYMRIEEYLEKYGDDVVSFLDPKYAHSPNSSRNEFFAFCDQLGPEKVVVKYSGDNVSFANAAKARGYTTWGYFYAASLPDPNFDAQAAAWDILGMSWDATQFDWDFIKAKGKPVLGHIAPSQAAYDQAIARGAAGVMCSATHLIAPVSRQT